MSVVFDGYESVIGLECHVQLQTQSKLFSPAPNHYGDAPNANADVVDLGLPGVLPVPNQRAIEFAVRLGLAVGATVHEKSVFARKHYFYPDLPKGYQISQYERPICEGGGIEIDTKDGKKFIRLTRIHIEEDAGKSTHSDDENASFVDFNRAGTPLLEVVSEPELRNPEDAMAYMRALHQLVMFLGICDGNLQEGSMRADANVSVRRRGDTVLGTRTETKNLNSPRFLSAAIAHEFRRQVIEIEGGRAIVQETRLWDSDAMTSRSMRTKEDALDYRYFPDPDLLPVVVDKATIERIKQSQPELPAAKLRRYVEVLHITEYDARVLCASPSMARFFDDAVSHHGNAKSIANWIINDVARLLSESKDDDGAPVELTSIPVTAAGVAALVKLVDDGVISGKIAKDVFQRMADGESHDPQFIVEKHALVVEKDTGKIEAVIDALIAGNASQVEKYRAGKTQILGWFVGQVMKETKGKSDPSVVNELVKLKLDVA